MMILYYWAIPLLASLVSGSPEEAFNSVPGTWAKVAKMSVDHHAHEPRKCVEFTDELTYKLSLFRGFQIFRDHPARLWPDRVQGALSLLRHLRQPQVGITSEGLEPDSMDELVHFLESCIEQLSNQDQVNTQLRATGQVPSWVWSKALSATSDYEGAERCVQFAQQYAENLAVSQGCFPDCMKSLDPITNYRYIDSYDSLQTIDCKSSDNAQLATFVATCLSHLEPLVEWPRIPNHVISRSLMEARHMEPETSCVHLGLSLMHYLASVNIRPDYGKLNMKSANIKEVTASFLRTLISKPQGQMLSASQLISPSLRDEFQATLKKCPIS